MAPNTFLNSTPRSFRRTDRMSKLLVNPELPLWIRTKCNLLLGGICQDVMEAKHYILEAEKQCEECLADCMEKDREESSVHQAIIRETLEELRPEERHFRMGDGRMCWERS